MSDRGPRRAAAAGLALFMLLCLGVSTAWATPRIGVLTMGPGAEYWSRFGHNAVLVESADGQRTVYNYGFFDFEQPGFLVRFLRGRMLYQLVALPFDRELAYYAAEGRGMDLQWLRLDPQAATELADFLAWNALPENAEYRYDYFLDNCSTRVRDAIDRALGGELRRQTHGRSRGLSQRSEALRHAAPEAWLYWGIHLGLGPATDVPMSRWEESFVPELLRQATRLVVHADGQPVVEEEISLLPQQVTPAPAETPRYNLLAALAGSVMGIALLLAGHRTDRLGAALRGLLAVFWLFAGLAGMGILALWCFTDHSAAWANQTAWVLSPLCLLLLPGLGQLRQDRPASRLLRFTALLVVLCWMVGLALAWLPVRPQDFREWLYFSGPLHFASLLLLQRRNDHPA